MKTKSLKPLLFISIPIILLVGIKVAMFPHFVVPTTGMEPAVQVQEIVWGKRTSSYGTGDVVFFEFEDPQFGKQIYLQRIVAGPGDKLEIKDGIVHVNDSMTDKYWKMKYNYFIETDDPMSIKKALGEKAQYDWVGAVNDTTYSIYLGAEDAIRLFHNSKIKSIERYIVPRGENDAVPIYNSAKNDWSVDNFGPLLIPAEHYFLMGDNRHNAYDSRFRGPVSSTKIRGVILNK